MAIAIPNGCWRQPQCSEGSGVSGDKRTVKIKGTRSELKTLMLTFVAGVTVVEEGWVASTWTLDDTPGEGGMLTIECVPEGGASDPEDPTSDPKALKVIWKCKSVRNDVSIMAYCGPSEGSNPHRTHIELWQKESDAQLADADQYHRNPHQIGQLTAADLLLVNKIRKGVEAVMRFYPILTCVATYSDCPPGMLERLSYIDTPAAPPSLKEVAPKNLQAVITAHTWLRCQDDVDETTDGKWTRTISWMGIANSDSGESSPWDVNLYGSGNDRWAMPLNL